MSRRRRVVFRSALSVRSHSCKMAMKERRLRMASASICCSSGNESGDCCRLSTIDTASRDWGHANRLRKAISDSLGYLLSSAFQQHGAPCWVWGNLGFNSFGLCPKPRRSPKKPTRHRNGEPTESESLQDFVWLLGTWEQLSMSQFRKA